MRKDVATMIGTLGKSVLEISGSGADNRDQLLNKSFDEFRDALFAKLEPVLPTEDEPLAKGLNHIACFANALRDIANRVQAIKTGQPAWLLGGDSSNGGVNEMLPPEIADALDRFVAHGVVTLRQMVNDTAELPEDDADLERAERAGKLIKIMGTGGQELLVKTALPEGYWEYLTDPLDLLIDYAELARDMQNEALLLAEPMAKNGEIPDTVVESYPELFEEPDSGTTRDGGRVGQNRPGLHKAEDENVGTGGDPGSANDPGSDDGQDGDGADGADDLPQNPLEAMVRLATIIVALGGSLLQSGAGDETDPNATSDASGMPDDSGANAGLTRMAPLSFGDVPLEKILKGEVEVSPSLADALESHLQLTKTYPGLQKELEDKNRELTLLKETVERLRATPAAPKGAISDRVMTVGKAEDMQSGTGGMLKNEHERIETLSKTNPDAAARDLIKLAHAGMGAPGR